MAHSRAERRTDKRAAVTSDSAPPTETPHAGSPPLTAPSLLQGERICLGPVMGKDMRPMFEWFNDRSVSFRGGPLLPIDEAAFLEWVSAAKMGRNRVLFTIRNRFSLELLGYVEIYGIDGFLRSAEIGIAIGSKAHRGRGFGHDALKVAIAYCWEELLLQRLSLRVIGENPAAQHLYAKLGFEVEGRLRRAAFARGEFRDVTLMGLLRPEAERNGTG